MPARGTAAAGKAASVASPRKKLWVLAQMITANAPAADVARVAFATCPELRINFLCGVYVIP